MSAGIIAAAALLPDEEKRKLLAMIKASETQDRP
jgi:hypothetical protein